MRVFNRSASFTAAADRLRAGSATSDERARSQGRGASFPHARRPNWLVIVLVAPCGRRSEVVIQARLEYRRAWYETGPQPGRLDPAESGNTTPPCCRVMTTCAVDGHARSLLARREAWSDERRFLAAEVAALCRGETTLAKHGPPLFTKNRKNRALRRRSHALACLRRGIARAWRPRSRGARNRPYV